MDALPTLTLTLTETNPDYVPVFKDGSPYAINRDEYQKEYEIEVEVVQLNLNTGGMRVRYEWPCKHTKRGVRMESRDVSIEHFFKQFEIKEI